MPGTLGRRLRTRRRRFRFAGGRRSLLRSGHDLGGKHKQLVFIHPLTPRPIARPQQLLHPMLQLPQFPLALHRFPEQPHHHLPQGRRITGELVGINFHRRVSPAPARPAPAPLPGPPIRSPVPGSACSWPPSVASPRPVPAAQNASCSSPARCSSTDSTARASAASWDLCSGSAAFPHTLYCSPRLPGCIGPRWVRRCWMASMRRSISLRFISCIITELSDSVNKKMPSP